MINLTKEQKKAAATAILIVLLVVSYYIFKQINPDVHMSSADEIVQNDSINEFIYDGVDTVGANLISARAGTVHRRHQRLCNLRMGILLCILRGVLPIQV